jgi:hypothetical protein
MKTFLDQVPGMHVEVKVYWQFLVIYVACRVTRRVPVPVPQG